MKILVPIEDEVFADEICHFLGKHHWSGSTSIKFVNVIEPIYLDHAMAAYPMLVETVTEEMRQTAKALVAKYSEKLKKILPEADVIGEVVEGSITPSLLQEIKSWSADLVVMGSHGRTGFDRFFLGSISFAIASHAPCSVAIIRADRSNETVDINCEKTESKPVSSNVQDAVSTI